ncbi:MAG: cell division protein FtsK, partial [Treponema sp.]|nr:cell division protein FtsK [Treponema sp.]
ESDEEKQESQDNDFSEPEKERTEPILSKEEYDALNKLNEDLLEENSLEEQEKNDNDSVEQLEWPATDEIISRAGITKDEEDSLIGENKEPEKPETNAEETEDEEDPYSAFDIDSAASDDGEYKTLSEEDEKLYEDANFLSADEEKKTENTLEPDFFDIDMNAEPEEAESGSDYEEDSYDEVNLEEDEDNYDSYNETSEDEQTTREMQALENDLLSEKASHENSVEEKRSFLDDMVNAQEDDEDFAEESEYSDSDEDDFGQTNSTFDIASDIFSDMEEDAREQLEAGKKPARFADPSEQTEEELAEEIKQDEDEAFETAEPPARTTIATEKKPEGHRVLPKKPYIVPTDLLEQYEDDQYWIIDEATKSDATKLKETLNQFGISAEIIGIKKGPVVTMFEIAPAPGVKLSKIVSLQDNIALSLAASSVRIVAPIPGKAAVGIETPNKKRSIVSFREIIEQDIPEFKKMAIPVILGKDILGKSQIIDIAKTPHLLIAGATGAGKSVCVNSLILSILYKRSPREVKMILVDPKVVELKLYNDIPHLLTPVITEPKRALQALQYCLCEMERRYALLDGLGVRDISNYNKRVEERNICTEKLPYIVVIIDEFADLMATSGRDLESIVARLTAMSRAVGIHLVLATQRPSVNVITGLIKANIPSRIAFMVSSRTDSNIIIDSVGAEKLLGKGDMLYASAVDPYPVRIQGTFESDNDVEAVVDYVKTLGEPEYIDEEIFIDEEEEEQGPSIFSEGDDPLYEQALEIVLQSGKASASYIQRRLKIGYNRAARLVEEMEARGIVGPANGSKPREVIHVPS